MVRVNIYFTCEVTEEAGPLQELSGLAQHTYEAMLMKLDHEFGAEDVMIVRSNQQRMTAVQPGSALDDQRWLKVRCSNCLKPVADHCRIHMMPCCPGRCSGERSDI